MWANTGLGSSEYAGGLDVLCSLSAFTIFTTGAACFMLNSCGESRQGAGCATCNATCCLLGIPTRGLLGARG